MREKILLPEFVAFIQAQNITGPIRAHLALDWACVASTQRGASGAARRLSIARRFLTYLQASAPDTEVPSQNLLPSAGEQNRTFLHRLSWRCYRNGPSESAPSVATPRHAVDLDWSVGEYGSARWRSHPAPGGRREVRP